MSKHTKVDRVRSSVLNHRRIRKDSRGRRWLLESLEDRTLFALLGIPTDLPSTLALNSSTGSLTYSATADQLSDTAIPVTFTLNSSTSVPISAPRAFALNISVDNNGNLLGPSTPIDLVISGTVDLTPYGGQLYTGTLLTGSITQFGYDDSTGTALYDARLTPTGGSLMSFFTGQDIGLFITSENSTFTGSFASNFSGETKALVGPIPLLTPTITTTPGSNVVLGSGVPMTDSASLSGGFNETGDITFGLYNSSNVLVDSETAPVDGPGTYSTPTGYLPTAPGTYQWVATYSGDATNSSVASTIGSEPESALAASPAITTTPSLTNVTLGSSSVTLGDTAQLSGGYNATGSITFSLFYNGGATPVDTESVSVSGNGSYTTPSGYTLPATAATGTYQWDATYSGDSNNNSVSDNGDPSEQVTVNPASPAIATTPSTSAVSLGSSLVTLTDTAALSGGYSETGNITFNLYYNGGLSPVDTEVVPVSGNGSYSTPTGYTISAAAAATGNYQWDASYSGDSNNNSVSDNGALNEQVIVNAATPSIVTTPGNSVVIGSGSTLGDSATLSGAFNPTGTITFTLDNSSNVAVYTDTVTVSGNGTYTTGGGNNPGGYLPLATGTYQWIAAYNGDSNNASVTSSKGSEPETVTSAAPSIATTPGGAVVIGSGSALTDSATLSGGYNETGTVTFTLDNSSNVAVYTDTVTVNGNGTYTTASGNNAGGYLPTATGTYQWIASYSGDSNNASVASSKGSEPETVTSAAPSINTTPGGAVVIGSGSKLSDSATLSGGVNETGTITFTLDNSSSVAVYTDTVTVNGNGTYTTASGNNAGGYLPTATGTYQWMASYSGDSNNASVASSKGSEPETVTSASPSIATTPGGAVVIGSGSKLSDSAALSGGVNETGTITFTLDNSSSVAVYTDTVTVNGNGTYTTASGNNAGGYLPTAIGTYQWIATYSGDSNNASVASSKGSEPETVTTCAPSLSTTPGGSIVIGSGNKLTDSATLSGGFNETGTITFTLDNSSNVAVYTDTVTVNGNGTYTTASGNNAGGYLPTATGTYQWIAAYSGDSNNASVTSAKGSEPETVTTCTPSLTTTPGGSVVMGSGNKLTDSATLSGGTSPTGTITFTLDNSSNVAVYTDTATVNGNGTYTTASGNNAGGYLPTAIGTYEWVATYSGDSKNAGLTSPSGSEPETVTSGITISGTKYLDLTGNGFSSDDTAQAGVVIDLYRESNSTSGLQTGTGGDTLVATTTTASNGTYSFTNLTAGTYYVAEVVPNGYIQTCGGPNGTAGSSYYTISAAWNTTYGNNNFDDFQIPTCTPTNVSYAVNNNNSISTVTNLRGNTQQGDTVTVTFTVSAGMSDTLSLASYTAPSATYSASTAYEQQIFDVASGTFGPGTHTLTVLIPNCYYQIDFFCGLAINQLVPTTGGPDSANITYAGEDRLISADNGGTQAYATKTITSGAFGTASYWSTTTGQNVIKSLNGSSTATTLAQWLATTFPNLYGSGAGSYSLVNSNGTYFTNTQVAADYISKFTGAAEQVLSTALSVYATSINLAGTNVHNTDSHFTTSLSGSGMYTYSVGTNGSAFGVANNTTATVMQLLEDLNSNTLAGASPSSAANTVFTAINTAGGVST